MAIFHIYRDLYFTTCTINNWTPILNDDDCKNIIADSFHYLYKENSVAIFAFVIMNNHFHVIWQILPPYSFNKIQHRLLKFTGQKLKFLLKDKNQISQLERLKVDKKDREYQIWKGRSLSVELFYDKTVAQKMDYIHDNPVRKGWVEQPEHYRYSSAGFYLSECRDWKFLTNFWHS